MARLKPKNAIVNAVDQLDRLNQSYPDLATPATIKVVGDMRRLFANPPELTPPTQSRDDHETLRALARSLLSERSLEDALDALRSRGHALAGIEQLIELVGNRDYLASLRREAREFQDNALSLEQIARLWNDLRRPALGDDHWTPRAVSLLLS